MISNFTTRPKSKLHLQVEIHDDERKIPEKYLNQTLILFIYLIICRN